MGNTTYEGIDRGADFGWVPACYEKKLIWQVIVKKFMISKQGAPLARVSFWANRR